MDTSILAHIASQFISQYENVANSSVAYLLNTYPSARTALGRIVEWTDMPTRYLTELGAGENGRPDVTGVNEHGEKKIIIEGKFWANLTSNQPANYLAALVPSGRVVFLVPERRRSSLAGELVQRSETGMLDDRIVVTTWGKYIDAAENENAKEPNHSLVSDLAQLRALCNQMDVEGMPPLSASDLDPMNGRITFQLADLIDECRELLGRWEPIDLKGSRATAWKLGYGFYFLAHGLGCQLYFSSYDWFTRKSATPFWLTIKAEGFKKSDSILNTLHHWDPENTYDEKGVATYAIRMRTGLDRRGAVEHIVKTVKAAIQVVISLRRIDAPVGEVVVDDEPPLST